MVWLHGNHGRPGLSNGNRRILDSNVLIQYIRRLSNRAQSSKRDAIRHAQILIEQKKTNCIVSPIVIEVLAGTLNGEDLAFHEAFLGQFEVIDNGEIPRDDWEKAKRFARPVIVPKSGRRRPRRQMRPSPTTPARQLGDCLILAIARRLDCDVVTEDRGLRAREDRTARS